MFSVLNNYSNHYTKYNEHYCYAYIWSVECRYSQ